MLYYILLQVRLDGIGLKEQYAQVALVAGSFVSSVAILLVLLRGAFAPLPEDDKHPLVPEQLKPLIDAISGDKKSGS